MCLPFSSVTIHIRACSAANERGRLPKLFKRYVRALKVAGLATLIPQKGGEKPLAAQVLAHQQQHGGDSEVLVQGDQVLGRLVYRRPDKSSMDFLAGPSFRPQLLPLHLGNRTGAATSFVSLEPIRIKDDDGLSRCRGDSAHRG